MSTMTPTSSVNESVKKTLDDLRTLRDEIRLQVHLAGREAREEWKRLEDRVVRATESARDFAGSTGRVLEEVKQDLRRFRASLKREGSEEDWL